MIALRTVLDIGGPEIGLCADATLGVALVVWGPDPFDLHDCCSDLHDCCSDLHDCCSDLHDCCSDLRGCCRSTPGSRRASLKV